MPPGEPERIQDKEVFFSGSETSPASDRLLVETTDLCRAQHEDRIDVGLIEPLQEEGSVAECFRAGFSEPLERFLAVLRIPRNVSRLDAACIEQCREVFRLPAERKTDDQLSVPGVSGGGIGDLLDDGTDGETGIVRAKVSGLGADLVEVDLDGDVLHPDRAEETVLHEVQKSCLVSDVLEDFPERFLVPAVRCRGYPEETGSAVAEVVDHLLPTVGEGVVSFIDDNQREMILRPFVQPGPEGLDTGYNRFRGEARAVIRFLFLGDHTHGEVEFLDRLVDQLLTVSHHECPPGLIRHDGGEDDGLAAASREHDQLPLPLRPAGGDGIDRSLLVGAQIHESRRLVAGERLKGFKR